MMSDADRDEQVSRLAVYDSAREAAAQRALVTAFVLGHLDDLSAGTALPAEPAWADLFVGPDEATDESTDEATDEAYERLLTAEAVYREAATSIATPVARSLVMFLG